MASSGNKTVCRICGKKFINESKRRMFYCSPECKKQGNYERTRISIEKRKHEKEMLKKSRESLIDFNLHAKANGKNYGQAQSEETLESIRPERWRGR